MQRMSRSHTIPPCVPMVRERERDRAVSAIITMFNRVCQLVLTAPLQIMRLIDIIIMIMILLNRGDWECRDSLMQGSIFKRRPPCVLISIKTCPFFAVRLLVVNYWCLQRQ